jgi:hypothetical protein
MDYLSLLEEFFDEFERWDFECNRIANEGWESHSLMEATWEQMYVVFDEIKTFRKSQVIVEALSS